jgi:hypothetical protein
MLWGKPSAEWCSSTKFGPHVSLFPVPIFGVNTNCFIWLGELNDWGSSSLRVYFFKPFRHWLLFLVFQGCFLQNSACVFMLESCPGPPESHASQTLRMVAILLIL